MTIVTFLVLLHLSPWYCQADWDQVEPRKKLFPNNFWRSYEIKQDPPPQKKKACYAQLFSSKSIEQTLDRDVGVWLVEKGCKLPNRSIRKAYILYNFCLKMIGFTWT